MSKFDLSQISGLFAIGRITQSGPQYGLIKRFKFPLHVLQEAQELRDSASKEDKTDFLDGLIDPVDQAMAYVVFNKNCRERDFIQDLQANGVVVIRSEQHSYVVGVNELLVYQMSFNITNNHVSDDWD